MLLYRSLVLMLGCLVASFAQADVAAQERPDWAKVFDKHQGHHRGG